MGAYYLGIDIGTYGSKGVLINADAQIIAYHHVNHQMEVPLPGYAEHDAEKTWWGDFCAISKTLLAKSGIDAKEIVGVGCSTIAPCCLPVDKDLRPLRKAILYGIDVRAAEEISELEAHYGKEAIFEKCGTPLTTQSAAAKILWIKKHEPEIYAKADKFITGSTYLVAKLTGNFVIDRYTAATWVPIFNMEALDWEKDLSLFCRRDQLADCRWTNEVAGNVHAQAAKETGLAIGTPVIVGTADASAEAFSVGVLEPGDLMLMYGSSIFMIHVVEQFTKDTRLWAGPYLFPDTYAVAAGISCAGTLTNWFRDNFAIDIQTQAEQNKVNIYSEMEKMAAKVPAGSDGLIVLPYFSGERTPINDPKAKGMLFGLTLQHTRAHIYKAILESIGYGIDQHFEIFAARQLETRKIMAVGGGIHNTIWMQAVSDICGKEQQIACVDTGAAYGDALLAALGTGRYKAPKEIAQAVQISHSVFPNPENKKIYSHAKTLYRQLYENTKALMHEDWLVK